MQRCGSILCQVHSDEYAVCSANSISITMDLTQYAATSLHVHNDLFLPKNLTTVTLARYKYELPDNGHRPKHVGAFSMNFNVNFSAF
jgi:hypothetical protein